MLRIYHRVKVNTELLNLNTAEIDETDYNNPLVKYLKGNERTTVPAGLIVGVTFNPYEFNKAYFEDTSPSGSVSNSEGGLSPVVIASSSVNDEPISWFGQTDITMRDSQGREVTTATDISDYRHKSGGHIDGFKNIHMKNKEDATVKIAWETLGNEPICGEFVFIIQQENCEC